MLPKITSFGILKVDQNISNAIKDRWGSRAWRGDAQHGVVGFIQGGQ